MVERIQETLVQRIWSSLHCIDWSDPVKSWNAGPSATCCWEAKRRCFTQLLGPHMSKNKLIKSECKTLKLLCVLDMEKHHITVITFHHLWQDNWWASGPLLSGDIWRLTSWINSVRNADHVDLEQKNITLFFEKFECVWNCCSMRQVCIGASMKDLGHNMDESQMSMNSSTFSLLSTNSLKLLCRNSPGNVPRKCEFEVNL